MSDHPSTEDANMSPRLVAIGNVGFWGELSVRKSSACILWVFLRFSSAYAKMSCKKDHKLSKGECMIFRAALLTYHFIYFYRELLFACLFNFQDSFSMSWDSFCRPVLS